MSIFTEDLTPEEELSQFTPNEVDNEIFAIEQFGGVYSGDIPNYNESTFLNSMNDNRDMWNIVPDEQFDTEAEPELTSEEPQAYDTGELTNEETSAEEQETPEADNLTEDIEQLDNTASDDDILEAEANLDEATIDAEITVDDSSQASDVQSITSIEDIFNLDNETSETQPAPESDEDIALDNNTIEETPEELDSEPIEDENTLEADSEEIEEAEVVEITEDTPQGAANIIDDDLRSMLLDDLESASVAEQAPVASVEYSDDIPEDSFSSNSEDKATANIEEVTWDSSTEEFHTKQKLKEDSDNADNGSNADRKGKMTEEEKNNNTKKFILIAAITVAVLILAIGGIIGYLYLSSKSNIPTETDTAKHEKATDSTVNIVSEALPGYKTIDSMPIDTVPEALELAPDTAETPLEALLETPPPNPRPIERPAPSKPAPKSKPAVALRPKVAEKPIEKVAQVVAPLKENEAINALYVVQVYSSISKSDAEERLSMLAQKNIKGYISTQQIKGQTWYRVRFGNYSDYNVAASEASRLGLNDVWIERVK